MADEISVSCSLSGSKGGLTVAGSQASTITLTGEGLWANRQTIGTSAEQIAFPSDLTTEGVTHVWFQNASASNFIEFALDSGMTNKFAKLLAGECMLVRVHTGSPTYYAKADTAACDLRLVAVGT